MKRLWFIILAMALTRVRNWFCGWFACTAIALAVMAWPRPAPAYITVPPGTLGLLCGWSEYVMTVRVDKVDREKGVIIFRKVRDLKGKWPRDVIKQVIPPRLPQAGYFPVLTLAEHKHIMDWAEVGKTTVLYSAETNGTGQQVHTYVENLWYGSYTPDRLTQFGEGAFWMANHVEPTLLRSFCAKPERLEAISSAILAGKEVVVPCMVGDYNLSQLQGGRAKIQCFRASLKRIDYNPKRDYVGEGGGDYFGRIAGMRGFSAYGALLAIGQEAQGISVVDARGDGKLDLCLTGADKIAVMQNLGDTFVESSLPGYSGGGRAAVWADYNGDGLPDLLLATPSGPKLFTNLGKGQFRDDSQLLPREPGYNLTCAAWIDYDGDGRPDILLGNGWNGLRLYRNLGEAAVANPTQPGKLPLPGVWFEDVTELVGLDPDSIGSSLKGDTLTVCDVNGDGRPDILYGAGSGLLLLNTPRGFVEAKDCGIVYRPGKIAPVFGDYDHSGHPGLFVPQLDGHCKLFKNDGQGRFTDVTAQSGDLAKPLGMATCAAWGDLGNSGHLDLVVGCLRGPNRYFRNQGNGTFEDATEALGLNRRIFNTRGIALVDLSNNGVLDLVLNNDGQESCILLANPQIATGTRTPLTLTVRGKTGVLGSRVRVVDEAGKTVALQEIGGGSGQGGQEGPLVRFALKPGTYRVEVTYSHGVIRVKDFTLTNSPVRGVIE